MANKDDFDDEVLDYELDEADGERIRKSLSKIKYQTSRHLCINTMLSIGTVVDWLDLFADRREVLFAFVGETRAYFLPENAPDGRRLFLGGDNSVHVAGAPAAPSPVNPNAPKIGDKVVLPKVVDYPAAGVSGRAYVDIDANELENLAAQGLSQKRIAEELDIGSSTLQAKLRDMSHLRKAFERGVKEFQKIKGTAAVFQSPPVEKKMGKQVETVETVGAPAEKKHGSNRRRIPIGTEAMEKAASENKTNEAIAGALGIALNTLFNKIKNSPELPEAHRRGRQIFKNGKPVAEIISPETLAEAKEFCASETGSEDDPNTVERFMEFREKRENARLSDDSIPGVLAPGPAISISMTIQIPLGSRSREFINRIQNLVQEFEA